MKYWQQKAKIKYKHMYKEMKTKMEIVKKIP